MAIIVVAIVAVLSVPSLFLLSSSRHGGRYLYYQRHEVIAIAIAGSEISITRQHCCEKTERKTCLLFSFSLVKQAWTFIAIAGIKSWPASSEISVTRQHCREKTERDLPSLFPLPRQAGIHQTGTRFQAMASNEIFVTRQHCREKTESEIVYLLSEFLLSLCNCFLLSFFSLIKQI